MLSENYNCPLGQASVFEQGYFASRNGFAIFNCPFRALSDQWHEWRKGWLTAKIVGKYIS